MHPRALIFVAALLAPSFALACGGVFCSQALLQPVEQNAEKILFTVNDDETITAVVEINYSGTPGDFSWVVPVPDTPITDVAPSTALASLDAQTRPVPVNQRTVCTQRSQRFGCDRPVRLGELPGAPRTRAALLASQVIAGSLASLEACPASSDDDDEAFGEFDGPPVEVEQLPQVGPYLQEVVSSSDPDALVDWLNTNGYLITEYMEPMVEMYVEAGMKFLAMKLAPNSNTNQIQPIVMTYPGAAPMIPIVLTGVGAEPEMGILTFIGAQQRYQPANFAHILVDSSDLRLDRSLSRTNYASLVSWLVDRAGGHAFVTEFAGDKDQALLGGSNASVLPEGDARWLAERLEDSTYVTRMYTRLSGSEMTEDPVFEPSPGEDIDNALDLSIADPIETCLEEDEAECGFSYCGPGSTCATTSLGDGCVCAPGELARSIADPTGGRPTVTCVDPRFDPLAAVPDFKGGEAQDPCVNYDCGGGECASVAGFPACSCDERMAAVMDFGTGRLTCTAAWNEYGPEQLLFVRTGDLAEAAATPKPFALAFLLLIPLLLRRVG